MVDLDGRMTQLLTEARSGRYSRRELLKRGVALGLSAPAIAAVMASSAAPSRVAAALQTTTLRFSHDKAPWDELYQDMSQMAADATGISLEITPFADTTSYQQTILSSLPTDEAPDIFTWWSGFRMEDLYESGNLLDVTSVWQQAVQDGNLPESLAEAFTFDGKQYGVPNHVSYWPTFYNKKVFDDNGLTPPTTWDELMAAADTLKGAGVTPFYATIDGRWPSFIWFEELLIRTNPDFYVDLTQGRKSYTDPVVTGAMETWRSMLEKGYFTALDIPMDTTAAGMFANGEIAMFQIGTWFQQQFIDAGMTPGEDFDAFVLPNVNPDLKENVIIVEAGPFAIPAQAANAEKSVEFFNWWVTPEAQSAWANKLGDAPANPKAKSENPILAKLISTLGEQRYRFIQRYWEASPAPIVESAVDELGRFMLNPDEAEEVLETIQGLAQAEWSKRGQ